LPNIVIYGSDGTLVVPDPNTFGGDVKIAKTGSWDFETVDLSHDFADNHRGLGVRDIADAIAENRPHRASGELAYHVLDIMHSIHDASREGKHQTLRAGPKRPEPMTALVEVA
jgi:predicted dehydrogenase